MITSNVDLNSNSEEETPDGDGEDQRNQGLPQISIDDLGKSFDEKKKHSSAQFPSNNRNNIPLTHFSPKKADTSQQKQSMSGTGQLEDVLEDDRDEEDEDTPQQFTLGPTEATMHLNQKNEPTIVADMIKHNQLISDISLKELELEQYISHEHQQQIEEQKIQAASNTVTTNAGKDGTAPEFFKPPTITANYSQMTHTTVIDQKEGDRTADDEREMQDFEDKMDALLE